MASEEVGYDPVSINAFWLQPCYKSESSFSEQPRFYELPTVLEQSEVAERNYMLRNIPEILFYFFHYFFLLPLPSCSS